jgi:hypothetical protein
MPPFIDCARDFEAIISSTPNLEKHEYSNPHFHIRKLRTREVPYLAKHNTANTQ